MACNAEAAGSGSGAPWWDALNRNAIRGPEPTSPTPAPATYEEIGRTTLGDTGFVEAETMRKNQRQKGGCRVSGRGSGTRAAEGWA